MEIKFTKVGRITSKNVKQGKNGTLYFTVGAVVDNCTFTVSSNGKCCENIDNIGLFNECMLHFTFTDSFNNPRISLVSVCELEEKRK